MKDSAKRDDKQLIFCLDNSGSMGTRVGEKNLKEVVESAIFRQINNFIDANNNKTVGTIVFTNVLHVLGDGS